MVGVGLWLVVLALGANLLARVFPVHPDAAAQMPGMGAPAGNPTPPVRGFYNGQEIRFIHTEASDPKVAEMLFFQNGVRGDGPFGFQPDVFDTAPGDPGYTPLRRVNLIVWRTGVTARTLRSAADVRAALRRGDITITQPGIVANMPFLSWPGGQR
jgi:hypothetical protein